MQTGSAQSSPKTAEALAYSIIATGCRRWLEGEIREHPSYTFYSGSQIKIFISKAQYEILQRMLQAEGLGTFNALDVHGKHLGEWFIDYFNGKWSCMLIFTLSKEFEQVHSVVKRFAQLAARPLRKDIQLHSCACGFPMVKPSIEGDWVCDQCWSKNQDLVF